MSNNKVVQQPGGIGFCGLLAIVFITLKLTKVIDWSWFWVLSSLWIPLAVFISLVVILALGAAVFK